MKILQNPPLVSIIIPTYNRAELLSKCIQSCIDQTYENLEIIIVDDGSTDNTPEISAEFRKNDSRIKYLKKENAGLPKALNFGFNAAKGSYFTWSSDDNYYSKDAILEMLTRLAEKNCSFVYCDYYKFRKTNPNSRRIVRLPDSNAISRGNHIGPCFLYTKEVAIIIGGYDPETTYAEDYDYWIRISKKFSVCHLEEPLYFYLEHEASLSIQKEFEIKLITLLVRIKNDILSINKAIEPILILKSNQNWKFGQKSSKLTFLPLKLFSQIYLIWTRIRLSKRVFNIISDYKMGKQNFTKTKTELMSLLLN